MADYIDDAENECELCHGWLRYPMRWTHMCDGHANNARNRKKRAREIARIKAGTATPSMIAQHAHRFKSKPST